MAFKFVDRAIMSVSGAPGTGDVTLLSALPAFQTFSSAGLADTNTFPYVIEDGTAWEIGLATYHSGGTFSRTTVTASSAGGTTKISASADAVVYCALRAQDVGAGSLAGQSDVSITSPSDSQVLTYVAADGKWENKAATGGGGGGGGAPITPTIVQSKIGMVGGSTGSWTITLNAAPTAGNALICFRVGGSGTGGVLGFPSPWQVTLSGTPTEGVAVMHVGSGQSATIGVAAGASGDIAVAVYEVSGVDFSQIGMNILNSADATFSRSSSLVLAACLGDDTTTRTLSGVTTDSSATGSAVSIVAGHTITSSNFASITTSGGGTFNTLSVNLVPTISGATGTGLFSQLIKDTPTQATKGLTTWLNQGSCSVSDNAVGMTLVGASQSGHVSGVMKTAPATPYKITALVSATRLTTAYDGCGLGWYDGSTKVHTLSLTANNGGKNFVEVDKWTNVTTFSASDYASLTVNSNDYPNPIWFQLEDDGTNVSFRFSADGASFITLFTVAKSSGWLGGSGYSNVLFFITPNTANSHTTLLAWNEA